MHYLLITTLLFLSLLAYFAIAKKFNITDTPNERSSHQKVTIRGGGIIFPITLICFLISFFLSSDVAGINYWFFALGLFVISVISFIDDMMMLSPRIRIVFHFIAVSLLLHAVGAFELPSWQVIPYYIMVIGILNSYNFMDGINGITGLYSLVALMFLYKVNGDLNLLDKDFIIFPILASIVFLFFNFRKKAICFAGDVGSFSISFWIITIIAAFVIYTDNYKYLLFLTVYGIDSVLTILQRIKLKENIFDAHRRHLYQILVNEKGHSHLLISFLYAAVQGIINLIIISTDYTFAIYFIGIVLPLVFCYIAGKMYLINSKNNI